MQFLRTALRRILPDLAIVIGLFVLPLGFFWQVTLGSRTLLPADNIYQYAPWSAYRDQVGVPAVPQNALLSDLVLENLPWKQFVRQSIANRELPLWNPYIFAGTPFLAEGQHSALYPFSLIYDVIPLEKAYGWFTVSQLWLAGFCMYLFMRGLGIGRFGATISAIAYQLSSFFIASVVFQMIIAAAAWLPFLLLMVEFTIQQRPVFGKRTVIPWIALGALGLGMEILAGHVEFTYYALLVMGFWSVCRLGYLLIRKQRDQLIKVALSLLALVILGVGIGAIQFVPLLDLARSNFREGSTSFAQVQSYAFPPRHALEFLMPNLYGSPAQHDYVDVFTGATKAFNWTRADGSTVTDTYWEVGKNYVEGACYVGLLTLFLAIIALLHAIFEKAPHAKIESAAPYRAIFAILSLVSLSFIFGTIAYAILYYGLPGINQLHSPFRWVFPLTLCLAALAGFGAEALVRARGESTFGAEYWRSANVSFTFRLAKQLGYALLGIGTAVLILLIASRVFFDRLQGPIESLFHKLALADQAFPDVGTFYSVEFRSILFFGLFLVACGCVIRVSRCPIYLPRRFGRLPVWMVMAVVILSLDLIVASAGFNPAADPAWLNFTPPAIQWLQQQNPSDWRFATIEAPGQPKVLNANLGWLYGLQDVAGYDSIISKQYVDYMGQIQDQNQLIYNRIAPLYADKLDALNSPQLDLLGVKYVVSTIEIDTTKYPKFKQVYQDQAVRIYENSAAQARIAVANDISPLPVVYTTASAQITKSTANETAVDVKLSGQETNPRLILADSYLPGWRAYLRPLGASDDQEKEVPILLEYNNFRGVDLPTGNQPSGYTVRFKYTPQSVQIGAFGTFIALIILLFAVLLWAWRLVGVHDVVESSNERRFAKNTFAPILLNLFNRGIDFGFALIMLRLLGPTDSGIYYTAVVIFGWFDILTNFGLNTWLTREAARDKPGARRLLLESSGLRLALAAAWIPLLVIYIFVRQSTTPPPSPIEITAIILLYIGLVPGSISTGLTALFYSFEKAEIPAAISTVTAICKAIFGLAALLAGWGVIGLAGVSILLNVITLALLAWQTRAFLPKADKMSQSKINLVDRVQMRAMIIASWPLMLNHLLASLFFKIDVTLLDPLKGSTVVGWYSAAYKWLDALGVIPSLFTMALLPIMSRLAKEDKAGLVRNYQFAVKLLVMTALPLAVAITFLAHTMIGVLGGDKFLPDGAIALQLMVWFIPIGWINSLTNYVLIALDQQKPMRWAFLIGVGFNLSFNLMLIPIFSYMASAVITVFSEIVLLIAFYILLRRAMGAVQWVAMLWKLFAAGAAMFAVMLILTPLLRDFAVIPGGAVYLGLLFVLHPFSGWELSRFVPLLPSPIRRWVKVEAPS